MSKYTEPFDDTLELFNNCFKQTGLQNVVKITLLANNKAKEIFKVTKANEVLKFKTGDDVIIIINESIFEKLTEEQKNIVVEEAIAYIAYDFDKDKIIISKPDFLAHSGVLRKYGFNTIEVVRESIKSLYNTQKEEDNE